MAKLGPYSYPDIRFGDAVEIAGRIASKFKGTVSVKGLAWELGMAEGSGTLFAKVAALRDFGLVEGRGELRVSPLAQRVLHPANPEEGQQARAEAFQRVELLRLLHARFRGEIADDMSLLVGLEEITRASRDEIVRRASLIQKHLTDAVRILGRKPQPAETAEYSATNKINQPLGQPADDAAGTGTGVGLSLVAAGRTLSVPLTAAYVDVAISLLTTIRGELTNPVQAAAQAQETMAADADAEAKEEAVQP